MSTTLYPSCDMKILALEQKLARADAQIAELQQSITVRDTEIARLETDLEVARREVKSLEEHLHALVEVSDDSTIERARAVLNGDDIGEDADEDAARAGNGGGV